MTRRERGSASIELVGLLPVLVVTVLALAQGAAAAYSVQAATDAARQAARASSLGGSAAQAAADALPAGVGLSGVEVGAPGHVAVSVRVLRLLPVGPATVTREAELPA